jgi:hypothetical protein
VLDPELVEECRQLSSFIRTFNLSKQTMPLRLKYEPRIINRQSRCFRKGLDLIIDRSRIGLWRENDKMPLRNGSARCGRGFSLDFLGRAWLERLGAIKASSGLIGVWASAGRARSRHPYNFLESSDFYWDYLIVTQRLEPKNPARLLKQLVPRRDLVALKLDLSAGSASSTLE